MPDNLCRVNAPLRHNLCCAFVLVVVAVHNLACVALLIIVNQQDFERAAKLRDEIKALLSKGGEA